MKNIDPQMTPEILRNARMVRQLKMAAAGEASESAAAGGAPANIFRDRLRANRAQQQQPAAAAGPTASRSGCDFMKIRCGRKKFSEIFLDTFCTHFVQKTTSESFV
jgi:hypothetical protein